MPIKALFKRKNSAFLAFRAKIPDPHFTYEKTKAQRGRDLPNVTHQNGGWAGRTPSLNPQARSFNFMWLSQNQVCTMPHLFRARTMGKWQQEEKQTPASEKQEPKSPVHCAGSASARSEAYILQNKHHCHRRWVCGIHRDHTANTLVN